MKVWRAAKQRQSDYWQRRFERTGMTEWAANELYWCLDHFLVSGEISYYLRNTHNDLEKSEREEIGREFVKKFSTAEWTTELRDILKAVHSKLWSDYKEKRIYDARQSLPRYYEFCENKAPHAFLQKLEASPLGGKLEFSDKNALAIMLTNYLNNSVQHVWGNQLTKLDLYDYKFAYRINKERLQKDEVRYI